MNLAQKIKSQIENNRLERNKEVREKLLKDVETTLLKGKIPVVFPPDKSLTWSWKEKIENLPYYDGCLEDLKDNGFVVEPVPVQIPHYSQDPFFLFPHRFPTITYTAYKVKLPPD